MAGDPHESQLLERARTGEREACAEIVQRHYRSVYGLLTHLTRDPERAADLTQEVFIAAWQKLGQFQGRSSLKTWLGRIAWFRYLDDGRSATRRQQKQHEFREAWQEPHVASPLQLTIDSENSRRLYQSVQQLKQQHRSVVILHYFQGLTFAETAEVLDVSTGTVKWWNTKALNQLRTLMSDNER